MAPISGITLDHVAVAVPSVPDALARWVAELGGVYLWGGDHEHGDGSQWPEPPGVEPPGRGAELVGPLLSVESFDWAERLYAGLLGGEAERDGERVVYRWPDSPLVVTLVPDDQAGARCL